VLVGLGGNEGGVVGGERELGVFTNCSHCFGSHCEVGIGLSELEVKRDARMKNREEYCFKGLFLYIMVWGKLTVSCLPNI